MEIEAIAKVVSLAVAVIGSALAFLHYMAIRRSTGSQTTKIEMELIAQGIEASRDAEALHLFLRSVRKEKTAQLILGRLISNRDLDRLISYHDKRGGAVTAAEIAKAWRYRRPERDQLSFVPTVWVKIELWLAIAFGTVCILGFIWGAGAFLFPELRTKQALGLVVVCLGGIIETAWINQELFTAVRLGRLEKATNFTDVKAPT